MMTTQPNHTRSDPLRDWLARAVEAEASDLHVVSGYPPVLRVHGELQELQPIALAPEAVREMLVQFCPPHAMDRFDADRNVDFALELTPRGKAQRFRVNYFMSGQQMGACFRVIPSA